MTSSQKGLAQAAQIPGTVTPGDAMFQGQDPWGNQGTPGGPVMSPEWGAFFDAINKYAPGGISAAKTKPMSNG